MTIFVNFFEEKESRADKEKGYSDSSNQMNKQIIKVFGYMIERVCMNANNEY